MNPAANSAADTTWVLISAGLVLMMTPALGFFYGGMVRTKNTLNTLMMSFVALGFVGVLWAVLGYSIAFASGSPWMGGFHFFCLRGVDLSPKGSIPHLLFMAYQATFAIITAALISGAIVERMKFSVYITFISLWSLCVYAPVAHWVWGEAGWLSSLGALDFAGGTVVHISAASAAVVAAGMVGARKDFARVAILPQNVPFTLLGTGLLWFGWFGFNAGSALAANNTAALAFVNTMLAPMGTLVSWTLLDYSRTKKITAIGAATGIVVGLVSITPAAGYISPMSAVVLGLLSAFPSYYALIWRTRTRLDDSLDVLAAHGVGGVFGAIMTGVFADQKWNGTANGLLHGNPRQVWIQLIACAAVLAYSALATGLLLKMLQLMGHLKTTDREQGVGMDVTQHGEEAYARGEGAILLPPEGGPVG